MYKPASNQQKRKKEKLCFVKNGNDSGIWNYKQIVFQSKKVSMAMLQDVAD